MRRNIASVFILLLIFVYACKQNNATKYYNTKDMQEILHTHLNKISDFDSSNLRHSISIPIELQLAESYYLNDYQLIWARPNGFHNALKEFVIQVASLEDEGIIFSDIKLSRIEHITNNIINQYSQQSNFNLDSIVYYDMELTRIYLTLAKQILIGQNNHIKSDINDTFYAGGQYLALATNKSQNFPSFDGFRPDNPLYTKLLLANKNWMVLQNDTEYLEAKAHLRNGNTSEKTIQTIIYKELLLSNKDLDITNLVKIFQHYRNLEKTGILDEKTMEILRRKPEEYKMRIRQNLEKLRFLHSQKDEQFIIVNSSNNVCKFYSNGILVYKGHVSISKTDSNYIYKTNLESITKNSPYRNNTNISTLQLQYERAFQGLRNELLVVDPSTNVLINPELIDNDSITSYLVFQKQDSQTPLSTTTILKYENKNSSTNPQIAINIRPFTNNSLEIKFIEAQKLLESIQQHSQLLQKDQEKTNNNLIFSKAIPIYVISLNFISDMDTGDLIYLN